jgi:hypothetical protein
MEEDRGTGGKGDRRGAHAKTPRRKEVEEMAKDEINMTREGRRTNVR